MIDSNLKNANILIIDDQRPNIDILIGLLQIQGYMNVKYTTDSRLAVNLFESFNPDLILLDLIMPHKSGYEVMKQINNMNPHGAYLPILVLTADISFKAKQLALTEGAKDFLAKPFDLIEVDLRIKNLLETRYLHQQLENQNQILEEKIKERTAELEIMNIDLNVAKEKAEASDRLKTAFLRNISHEIRTPLNGILGFGGRLAKRDLTPGKKEEYFALLQSSSDRLAHTITDYLDIALIISGNLIVKDGVFAPVVMLGEILDKFRRLSDAKNINLTLQVPLQVRTLNIKSDNSLLDKVIYHLIDNAIKFSNQGTITVGFEIKGQELEFFVQDKGVGINNDAHARIFDHFMQEDVSSTRCYEGNGLGLSIAKKIIELLGGRIWLQSVKGEGSTFYFTIPYCPVS